MLHKAYTSKGGAVVTRKEIGRLAATEFNGRQVVLLMQYIWRLLPLINFLLDQERGHHRSRFSYQEKYSSGLFPCPAGGQGERELHPRIQRHKRC
jgi:hypothetical protein